MRLQDPGRVLRKAREGCRWRRFTDSVTVGTIPFGGHMDFFSLRGLPAYYTFIDLGPLGGTLAKSASRQMLLFIYVSLDVIMPVVVG
jgi:hypothetical protein